MKGAIEHKTLDPVSLQKGIRHLKEGGGLNTKSMEAFITIRN
jgi:hypothetical protein